MDSRLSDHCLHQGAYILTSMHNTINTSSPSSFNFFQINSELSPRLKLLALLKEETCLYVPEFFREYFVFRNKEQELSCLSKPAPTPALSQTHISPVVRIGPRAVEQSHKWSLVPTDGVQGQGNPIHRGEHEEGECKDESLMVLLPYAAVNPPKGKKRLLCLKKETVFYFFFLPQLSENLISKVLPVDTG